MIQPVQTQIVVTDVSRMGGERICLAGVDADGRTWRPEPENRLGLQRTDLKTASDELIRTGSVVEFFGRPKDPIEPPHVEDVVYLGKLKFIRHANESMWIDAMQATRFPSVDAVFNHFMRGRRYVPPLSKTRSLGTVIPVASTVECTVTDASKPTIRMRFKDSTGTDYAGWAVNDLALVEYVSGCDFEGMIDREIGSRVTRSLRRAEQLFLRVGLTRPFPAENPQCWAQVTGIHTSRPSGS